MLNKKYSDISVLVIARVASSRCKNKMLRSFAGSSLIDIILKKLHDLSDYNIYYVAHEEVLLKKAKPYDFLKVVKRSYESAHSQNDGKLVFEILNHINTRWVVWINPCAPFLKMNTVKRAVDKFLEIENNSLTSVKKVYGWFYDNSFDHLTNKDNRIASQEADYLYEVAHAFHIYDREYMLNKGKPWTNKKGDPYLFVIPNEECYDIDTEEDFIMVERLYVEKIK